MYICPPALAHIGLSASPNFQFSLVGTFCTDIGLDAANVILYFEIAKKILLFIYTKTVVELEVVTYSLPSSVILPNTIFAFLMLNTPRSAHNKIFGAKFLSFERARINGLYTVN